MRRKSGKTIMPFVSSMREKFVLFETVFARHWYGFCGCCHNGIN